MTLRKASIREVEGRKQRLTCRFNPSKYTITTSAEWASTPISGDDKVAQYIGSKPRSLQMELFLDAWESGSKSVAADLECLYGWTAPTTASKRKGRPRPPLLVFEWGRSSAARFQAFLSSVSATYTMFQPDGTPLRATANITLQEAPEKVAGQNPSSGGAGGERSVVLCAGDSLHSIAYAEYGDAAAWRVIAEFNGIDDPLTLTCGTRLLLPPDAEEAAS